MLRIPIRNLRSARRRNPRVFDVLIDGKQVYLEIKTGKAETELILVTDVLEQIQTAAESQLNIVAKSQSTTAT